MSADDNDAERIASKSDELADALTSIIRRVLSHSRGALPFSLRLAQASPFDLLPFGVRERLIVGAQELIPHKIQGEISFTEVARPAGDDARSVLEESRTGAFDDVGTDEPGWPTEIGAVLQLLKPNEAPRVAIGRSCGAIETCALHRSPNAFLSRL
jgi:hypothetical protein